MNQKSYFGQVQIIGLKEVQRDLRRLQGKLPKVIGDVHKEVGQFIIGKVPEGDAHAVGSGTGASLRASAKKREVVLYVGTSARADRYAQPGYGQRRSLAAVQWGKTEVQPFVGGRPYIFGAMEEHHDEIAQMFLDKYAECLGEAFYKVR